MTDKISEKALVSIIMPAYNCQKFITQALDSILAQTYPHWELLIADDASKDATRAIIDKYANKEPRIKLFHNNENLGYLKTWNKLLDQAKGAFITFQDADDWSHPRRLEILLEAFKKNPGLGAIGSNYAKTDEKGQILFESRLALRPEEIFSRMPEHFDFVGSGLMVRREVVKAVGGYHEFFDRLGSEDLYWGYRIAEKFGIANVPDVLYYYRTNMRSVALTLTTSPGKWLSLEYARFFILQRRRTGTDFLEAGQIEEAQQLRQAWEAPFKADPGLLFEKVAARRFYEGYKRLGRILQFKAWLKTPWKLKRLRDWLYYLRT
ncbi:MAG: glycosyltransferase [Flavobacteriales bacterium]|nr:glycosyltransferase [Flavobacteriales bacterium]MCX7768658.1 glycosyltransferase [Flavobacteriales bacterium]MDW8410789.1 glycosyltransferase family 2 protein [Flavobacteriales bacterium]